MADEVTLSLYLRRVLLTQPAMPEARWMKHTAVTRWSHTSCNASRPVRVRHGAAQRYAGRAARKA